MLVHPDKTESMLICSRQKRQIIYRDKLNIFVNNNPINQVAKRKLLGIVIDQNLLWTDHVTHLIKQISKSVFQLSQIKKFLDEKSRKAFYFGHSQWHLDYCSPIWGKCAISTSKRLYSLQKRAVKLILHHKIKHTRTIFEELHIIPFHGRIDFKTCLLMHKVFNNLAPPNLKCIFKFQCQPEPSHHQPNQIYSKHPFHLMSVYSGIVYQKCYAKFHHCRPSKKNRGRSFRYTRLDLLVKKVIF